MSSDNYSNKSEFDRMINEIDKQILNIIQKDARISNAEIARQVGLAPSAVLERVKKLEERGVIKGFEAKLDAVQLYFGLTAFVAVRTHECCAETDKFLAEIPEVLEVHDVAGEDSYFAQGARQKYRASFKTFARAVKKRAECSGDQNDDRFADDQRNDRAANRINGGSGRKNETARKEVKVLRSRGSKCRIKELQKLIRIVIWCC